MTEIDVTAILPGVDFQPASEEAEIVQNVRTILATRRGSVPLDREFGLDWSFVDRPMPVAQAMLSTDVIQQVRRYEPRARVIRVTLDETADAADGHSRPRVTIGVNDDG